MELRELDADDVRPLRTKSLRPSYPDGETKTFEGDEAENTHHYALVDDNDKPVAVVTYIRRSPPDTLGKPAVRLRGMAVEQGHRRRGLGTRLLQNSLTRLAVAAPDLTVVWCHARTAAAEFYEGHGFERHGEVFDIEGIGPHIVMWREMPNVLA
jgi:predicted GNAT family N-acyltransferase